jgi:MraZ protein
LQQAEWGIVFLGSHAITMDSKGRLAIPAKIRDALVSECGGRLVITAHTEERCLLVYPEPQWLDLLPKIEALPNIHRKARLAQRLLLGYATPLELDANGRVLLPTPLRDYADLEKKLLLVGQGKKLELWSETSWFDWLGAAGEGDDMPEEMLSLSL